MKLVMLFGSNAVGKMTVGQELAKQTGMRLFHNHMSIEPVLEIFGEFNGPVINGFRQLVFEEFSKTEQYGLIFTYIWAFDQPSDWEYVRQVKELFEKRGAQVYFAELTAPLEVRLERNHTENRLRCKPSKRDLAFSDRDLLQTAEKYRTVSYEGEIPYANYIKIDNSQLAPQETARIIREHFQL